MNEENIRPAQLEHAKAVIEKKLLEICGERCEERDVKCTGCMAWLAFDLLQDFIDIEPAP